MGGYCLGTFVHIFDQSRINSSETFSVHNLTNSMESTKKKNNQIRMVDHFIHIYHKCACERIPYTGHNHVRTYRFVSRVVAFGRFASR